MSNAPPGVLKVQRAIGRQILFQHSEWAKLFETIFPILHRRYRWHYDNIYSLLYANTV